jgi:hypothetical protein
MLLDVHRTILPKEKEQLEFQKQQKQEYKLFGQMLMIPGLILWEFDYNKMDLKKAEFKGTNSICFDTLKRDGNKKVMYNQNAIYFQAHCRRTAVKKANKIIVKATGIKDYFKA